MGTDWIIDFRVTRACQKLLCKFIIVSSSIIHKCCSYNYHFTPVLYLSAKGMFLYLNHNILWESKFFVSYNSNLHRNILYVLFFIKYTFKTCNFYIKLKNYLLLNWPQVEIHTDFVNRFCAVAFYCLVNRKWLNLMAWSYAACSTKDTWTLKPAPVSGRSQPPSTYGMKYFASLNEFDLSTGFIKSKSSGSAKSPENLYPCLMETVAYCPNLKKVTGIQINTEKAFFASRAQLRNLTNLTSISIFGNGVKTSDFFYFLKLLPHLRSVNFSRFNNEIINNVTDNDDVSKEEKINVQELSLQRFDVLSIFCLETLEKIVVSSNLFGSEQDVKFFNTSLGHFGNLKVLEMNISLPFSKASFLKIMNVVDELPNFKRLVVNLRGKMKDVKSFSNQCRRVRECTENLTISEADLTGYLCSIT